MAGANTNMALVESATPTRRKATNQRILRGPATPLAGSSRPALLDADVDMGRTDEQDSAERLSEGTVLVKDDINAVTVYSNLPVELHQILESAGEFLERRLRQLPQHDRGSAGKLGGRFLM